MPPSAVKKHRKVARMSAGSKPPRVQIARNDDKLDESSDDAKEELCEDDDDYSLIDDKNDEYGTVSPAPANGIKTLPAGRSHSRVADERGHTPPLTTRSRSKSTQFNTSDETLSVSNGPSVSQLDTSNHSHSQSSKVRGVASSSVERPAGKSLDQTTLSLKASSVPGVGDLSRDEYEMLLAYRGSSRSDDSDKQRVSQTVANPGDHSPYSPLPRNAKSSTTRGVKRSHGVVDSDSTLVPANIEAAFNASVDVPPSPKKKKTGTTSIASSTQTLHTENIKTITQLPPRCGVTDPSIQDPLLKNVYRSLPNISKGMFVTWSTSIGPGNFLIGRWKQHCPYINIRSLWASINFVQKDQYITLSRVNPIGLQAISQVYGDRKRWTLSVNGKTAVCVSVMMAVKSALQEPSTVVASQKARWSKFITAIPHAQEFERLVGVVCMAFHQKSLHAQIHCDAITFSTKTFAKDQAAVRAQFSEGVPSTSTKSARSGTSSTDDSLHWEDDVPVYDGRDSILDFSRFIDDMDRLLPRFEDNGSEVPNGSCVAVAYTVSQYELSKKESVSFNIRFVVVIATPDDEGPAEETEPVEETEPAQADVDSDAD